MRDHANKVRDEQGCLSTSHMELSRHQEPNSTAQQQPSSQPINTYNTTLAIEQHETTATPPHQQQQHHRTPAALTTTRTTTVTNTATKATTKYSSNSHSTKKNQRISSSRGKKTSNPQKRATRSDHNQNINVYRNTAKSIPAKTIVPNHANNHNNKQPPIRRRSNSWTMVSNLSVGGLPFLPVFSCR
eukprot:m.11957 g.11957  ORF g.11957 m.11957 type:complete len:187 (-) comp7902_c0_seq1:56-616(-)